MISDDEIRAAVALGHDVSAPLPAIDVSARLSALQQAAFAGEMAPDAFLITNLTNVRYLAGFTGSAGRLWLTATDAVFITDGRYAERATSELTEVNCGARIEVRRTVLDQRQLLRELIDASRTKRLALESAHVSWAAAEDYRGLLSDIDDTELVALLDVVEDLRRTKDAAELCRLARASAIADNALIKVLPSLANRPTEIDFARELEAAMADLGSEEPSFRTIIASGPNASRPHHEPSNRRVERTDEVICDFGATIDGYHSDMTRTVYVGPPSAEQRHHFSVVAKAQRAGRDAITSGVEGKEIDNVCRTVISDAGWVDYFVHGTGHGSGLLIHEAPWAGLTSTSTLQVGDILTIEPGVYIPGVGGVRVEDSLVVLESGSVLLTRAPYDIVV